MAEESAGFIGWKIGQKPNTFAILVGWFCCCFLGIWNLHLYMTEMENELGLNSDMHWIKALLPLYGLYEIDKHLSVLEGKYNIQRQNESMPVSLIVPLVASLPCLAFLNILLPFKVGNMLVRANAVKEAQANA